jgi:hypothetical protein
MGGTSWSASTNLRVTSAAVDLSIATAHDEGSCTAASRAPHATNAHDKQLLNASYMAASAERSRSPQHASTAVLIAARSAALAARTSLPVEGLGSLGSLKGILRDNERRCLQGAQQPFSLTLCLHATCSGGVVKLCV